MKRYTAVVAMLVALVATSVALAATKSIAGTYTVKITGKGANTLKGALDGSWKLVLKHGTYKVSQNGKAKVNGNYTTKGSTISLTDSGGRAKCVGTGKYKFSLKSNSLTLTKVSDTKSCAGREAVLAHKLSKQKQTPVSGY